jgi:hypothetical protein
MQAIIIHGMGRTPLSMCLLAFRLRRAGIRPHLFGYSATFERWDNCTTRLRKVIENKVHNEDYIVVTHSLGSVLIRAVLPSLRLPPTACYLLAPPTQASAAANRLAQYGWYRVLAGEMGQLLANQEFMSSLSIPNVPTKIYSGNAGLIGRHSPYGNEPNDGVLMVKETLLPGIPVQIVPSLHTFIMNNKAIAKNIIENVKAT